MFYCDEPSGNNQVTAPTDVNSAVALVDVEQDSTAAAVATTPDEPMTSSRDDDKDPELLLPTPPTYLAGMAEAYEGPAVNAAQGWGMYPYYVLPTAEDMSTHASANTYTADPAPSEPTRDYVNAVVSNIAASMPGFDGSSRALRMCPGAKVEVQPDVRAPDGADEFAAAWYGIAHAIIAAVVAQESPEKAALRTSVGNNGSLPLSLSVREARRVFASGLGSILSEVMQDGARSLYISPRNAFKYGEEVRQVSARAMEDWQAKEVLPLPLRERYARLAALSAAPDADQATSSNSSANSSDVAVQSVQDLELILTADADVWVTTFFPLCQHLKRDNTRDLCPIWAKEDTLRSLVIEEMAYNIHFLCTLKRLLTNSAGHPRGVVVPREWLQHLLRWLSAVMEAERQVPANCASDNEEEAAGEDSGKRNAVLDALRGCPGPIDTLSTVSVAPGAPAKHWLLPEGRAHVEVVPERLFDYLYLLFGGGPRYVTHGEFTMQEELMELLKPHPLRIDVTFRVDIIEDGAKKVEEATVYVEDAVRQTDLGEVLRLAMGLVHDDDEPIMSKGLEEQLAVAVCSSAAFLHLAVTSLNDLFLTEPMVVEGDLARSCVWETVGDALKQLTAESKTPPRVDEVRTLAVVVTFKSAGEGQPGGVPASMIARSGVCGLANIGNTCYMNSALQCISALQPFQQDILTYPVSQIPTATITSAYVNLLTAMLSATCEFAETRELKEAIGEKERRFKGFQQQDANEFIEVMLDRMEEELNTVSSRSYRERADTDRNIPICELSQLFWDNFLENNTGPIPRDFFHQSKTVFRCLTCGESSTVFDNNLTLSVNIKDPAVRKSLSVTVLVKRPTSKPGSDDMGEALQPQRDVIVVNLNIRVAATADGTVTEADVIEALRLALMKSSELKQKILSRANEESATAARDEGTADPTLYFAIEVLNLRELGALYAFATCTVASTAASVAGTLTPKPDYRVWYFLKDSQDFTATSYGSFVYVEDLPNGAEAVQPSTLNLSDTLSSVADADRASSTGKRSLPRANAEEKGETASANTSSTTVPFGPLSAAEGAAAKRPVERPLTRHIVKMGKHLAGSLIRPAAEEAGAADAGIETTMDYMALGTTTGFSVGSNTSAEASAPSGEQAVRKLALSIMYRKDRRTPLLDVTKDSRIHGDAWIESCRADVISDGADVKKPTTGTGPTANVVIFLQYNGIGLEKVLMETVDEAPSRFGWGGGIGTGCGGGSRGFSTMDADDDSDQPACTLQDCLSRSMETDKLTGDDSWYCPQCKAFEETCVQRSLFRIPPCLIISFKRFKMASGYQANKNNTPVTFPTHLDFSPFLDKEARANANLNPHTQYKLRGVVYHSGSLSFGHYTASVYNDRLGRWMYCNDTNVTAERTGEPSPQGAYILCYEQVRPTGTRGKPPRDF